MSVFYWKPVVLVFVGGVKISGKSHQTDVFSTFTTHWPCQHFSSKWHKHHGRRLKNHVLDKGYSCLSGFWLYCMYYLLWCNGQTVPGWVISRSQWNQQWGNSFCRKTKPLKVHSSTEFDQLQSKEKKKIFHLPNFRVCHGHLGPVSHKEVHRHPLPAGHAHL